MQQNNHKLKGIGPSYCLKNMNKQIDPPFSASSWLPRGKHSKRVFI